MTNEEAIAYTKGICVCSGCVDFERNDGCEGCEHMAWWKYIMDILNRQTPKKPIKKMRDYICSYCSHTVYRTENFCSNCGNGIDWE